MVTGGAGFLGRHVVAELERRGGFAEIVVPRSVEVDLRDRVAARALLDETRPDLVIHLAAVVGGIGANRANPGSYLYDNLTMGVEVVEAARLAGVAKVVTVGTVCSYPRDTPVPFVEESLWDGYPEPTNAPYGLAKKMLLGMGQAYRQQYGLDAVHVLPTNLYGPGDCVDPERSHVIPALILKLADAAREGAEAVSLWGTGRETRDFLYVADAAEGIVSAALSYSEPEPLNLGTGVETSIRGLAELIAELVGYSGELRFDPRHPGGQPRRCVSSQRARAALGWEATTPLHDGLAKTVAALL